VLVVDDVITTGSTMLAVCGALKSKAPNLKISVLSLALTAQD
jgi:predicted amidophosphoribosyltransferase